MKFILNQGDLLQINIGNWLISNKYEATCYQVYAGDAVVYDGSMLKQYYIRKSDILTACSTWGNHFYIETAPGYVHEFTGTVTTIGLLQAEFNGALKGKVTFKP